MKKLFVLCVLALGSLSALSAASKTPSSKTYELSFSTVAKIGSVQLKAGDYTLKVVGDKAIFTLTETGKQYAVPAKIDTVDKKFEDLHVNATREGDAVVVKEIELGGSKEKVEFSN